jgi:hypothetical protein
VPDLVNAWMVGGVLLHLAGQLARGRAWHAVIRAAHGAEVTVRRRDVLRAWVAGAGVTGIVSARGGDVVRVLMLKQRLPGTTCATLAGTLAAETVAETACGAVVVGWAAGAGLMPAAGGTGLLAAAGAIAAAIAVAAACARRWKRLRRVRDDAWQGLAALRRPAFYGRRVLPWEVLGRTVRLASLTCFLLAFGLPVSLAAVALVMAAQAGGRLVPFGPAGTGVSLAIVAVAFGTVTGEAVALDRLAAFVVGTSAVLTAVGLSLSAALVLQALPVPALRRALAARHAEAGAVG